MHLLEVAFYMLMTDPLTFAICGLGCLLTLIRSGRWPDDAPHAGKKRGKRYLIEMAYVKVTVQIYTHTKCVCLIFSLFLSTVISDPFPLRTSNFMHNTNISINVYIQCSTNCYMFMLENICYFH